MKLQTQLVDADYHTINYSYIFVSDAQLGETCVEGRTGECSDPTKTECSNASICVCSSAYFDTSGFEVGGSCSNSKNSTASYYTCITITEGEGGHIAFGADPVGVGIRVASFLHSYHLNQWVDLNKLAQTHYWDRWKEVFRFW